MKKEYQKPTIEIEEFEVEDIALFNGSVGNSIEIKWPY